VQQACGECAGGGIRSQRIDGVVCDKCDFRDVDERLPDAGDFADARPAGIDQH
jgi:hypothetical protein